MVKTKIISTLGPACSSESMLRKMMLSGMDIARLNFSHGLPGEFIDKIAIIRLLNRKYRRHLKILGDLEGHRIRIGQLNEPIELKKNKLVWLTQQSMQSTSEKIAFDYKGSLKNIKAGYYIYIDDGNICLQVLSRRKRNLKVKVIIGGLLKSRKGINIPQAKLDFGCLSRKDITDIKFCAKNGIEYIAQSFVCNKDDIREVKNVLGPETPVKVIAKIENKQGIRNIDQIIQASDGIMVARGDMGVSLPIYEIPVIQKMIIKKCNLAGKFVITATQMLESMSQNRLPTRAEVSDCANAIIDGSDFLMLSAETAVGKYPTESVKMMDNIIKFTEKYLKTANQIRE
ncbi:MAG: pyruvate kinase [Candidatus Omnitrophota bacterium]